MAGDAASGARPAGRTKKKAAVIGTAAFPLTGTFSSDGYAIASIMAFKVGLGRIAFDVLTGSGS